MKALLVKVDAVLTTLFGSTVYNDPSGADRIMRTFVGAMPPKRDSSGQGYDFPFRLTRLQGFDLTRDGIRYRVVTEIGFYTSGNVDAGITLISAILDKVEGIPNQGFVPYKLIGEVVGQISEETEHPYYQMTLGMEFRGHN